MGRGDQVKILYNIIFFLGVVFYGNSNALTSSVIIPCHHAHFKHLKELLLLLSQQTELPDEVVISLSEVNKVPASELKSLELATYPFSLVIIKHPKQLNAGLNRNSACAHAKGDVFICQDADDIPHPQRVEIIKHFFSNYDIDHLIHLYIPEWTQGNRPEWYWGLHQKEKIQFSELLRWSQVAGSYFHGGNIAIKRTLFAQIQWPDMAGGEDTKFNNMIIENKKKSILLDVHLLIYRNYLSTVYASRVSKR